MRRTIILSLAAFVVASSMAGAAKMPKGSFLKSHVTGVDQLAQQVINDAIVAARYARHFRTPRNSIVDYFQMNLRIGKLRKDYETTVYVVSDKVKISSTRKTLSKGTHVFVLPNGQPFLEAATGCPLANGLPLPIGVEPKGVTAAGGPSSAGSGNAVLAEATGEDGVLTRVLGTPAMEAGVAPEVALAGLPADGAAVLMAPNAAAAIEPLVEIVSAAPVSSAGSFLGLPSFSGFLPVAAALGGVALAASAGGGGSNSGGGGGNVDPPPTIPEPSSMIAVALGAAGIGASWFRRRFRS